MGQNGKGWPKPPHFGSHLDCSRSDPWQTCLTFGLESGSSLNLLSCVSALGCSPQERKLLSAQLQERAEQSLHLFQKRDDLDELEGFQQQELAKVKHMVRFPRGCPVGGRIRSPGLPRGGGI